MEMQSRFEKEISSRKTGDRLWEANITDNWNINKIPNGGYLLAIAGRIFKEALPHKDPLTITGHYLSRSDHGIISCRSELLHAGRNFSTGEVRFMQSGVEKIHFTAIYTDFNRAEGLTHYETEAPELPPPSECVSMPSFGVYSLYDQIDLKMAPESAKWMEGQLSDKSEIKGWVKLKDTDKNDLMCTLLFADAFPPPIFVRVGLAGWVPTLELTVHLKKEPVPGYIKCRFRSRFLTNGIVEEDGELWDQEGGLVAVSRQLAQVRMPAK